MTSEKALLKNKILVIGRRRVGKLALITKLLTVVSHPLPPDLPPATNPTGHAGLKIPWRIDTKYYAADVQFWVDETASPGEEAVEEAMRQYEDKANGVGDVVDAIVFVFRRDRHDTFTDLERWTPFVRRYEPAIALCVGVEAGLVGGEANVEAGTAKEREEYEDWCLENGFEYIDLDAREEDDDNTGSDHAEATRTTDPPGLARVLEALQSNMWDGMTRKPAASDGADRLRHIQREEEDECDEEEDRYRKERSGAPSPVPAAVRRGRGRAGEVVVKEEEEEEEEEEEFYEEGGDDVQPWSLDEDGFRTAILRRSSRFIDQRFCLLPHGLAALSRMKVRDEIADSTLISDRREGEADDGGDHTKLQKDILSFEDGEDELDFDLPTKTEVDQMHREIFGDFESEDGLDRAFSTLQGLRAKGQTMSDADRKALAAKVALSFAAQFGM
ncbi:hypothetical protein BC936DRAFT_150010 [Jimgerdemannia flammicorona]|uniref:Alpha and gamma adaptin binding protein p34-domain-containing protein n=1 Tax=Jimgerdemannia flammicorona TaxID=994334 RepID=A0A433CZQ0_9FUNG|nr:hypothetical protein BC936DRAFT_150010 [Jimgerdemannia flammicorona]